MGCTGRTSTGSSADSATATTTTSTGAGMGGGSTTGSTNSGGAVNTGGVGGVSTGGGGMGGSSNPGCVPSFPVPGQRCEMGTDCPATNQQVCSCLSGIWSCRFTVCPSQSECPSNGGSCDYLTCNSARLPNGCHCDSTVPMGQSVHHCYCRQGPVDDGGTSVDDAAGGAGGAGGVDDAAGGAGGR
jgi:hypothetical protein